MQKILNAIRNNHQKVEHWVILKRYNVSKLTLTLYHCSISPVKQRLQNIPELMSKLFRGTLLESCTDVHIGLETDIGNRLCKHDDRFRVTIFTEL